MSFFTSTENIFAEQNKTQMESIEDLSLVSGYGRSVMLLLRYNCFNVIILNWQLWTKLLNSYHYASPPLLTVAKIMGNKLLTERGYHLTTEPEKLQLTGAKVSQLTNQPQETCWVCEHCLYVCHPTACQTLTPTFHWLRYQPCSLTGVRVCEMIHVLLFQRTDDSFNRLHIMLMY